MGDLVADPVSGTDRGLREALVAADLPTDDIEASGRRFFRFSENGRVVGFGGFEPHGAYALLRSIVVLPAARGQGQGRAITEGIMAKAREAGCAEGFLLTTSAAGFFEHLGFARLDRADAPEAILATRQAATICSTAALLGRSLASA